MTLEYLASSPSSSTWMNATLLYLFRYVITRNFCMSRGGCILIDVNPKDYEVALYIATKDEVKPRMLLILKKVKFI